MLDHEGSSQYSASDLEHLPEGDREAFQGFMVEIN